MVILISVDSSQGVFPEIKRDVSQMMKGSIHQENITILNINASNNRSKTWQN